MRMRWVSPLVLFLVAQAGCSSKTDEPGSSGGPGGEAYFTVPSSLEAVENLKFFDHPWPSDARRDPDGSVRMGGFPNPRESALFKTWSEQMKGKQDGFSPTAAGYLPFTTALDLATLPASAAASMLPTSSLQLVVVDDKSPDFGKRHPVSWLFRERLGDYYLVPNTLSWSPPLGMPMRRKTTYAIVATQALKAKAGGAIRANAALKDVLAGKGSLGAAWAKAVSGLEKSGIKKDDIAHLSVFTTSDPEKELIAVAESVRSLPAPKLKDLVNVSRGSGTFDRFDGNYEGSPDYQEGEVPFRTKGGGFVLDASGKAVKQRDFSLRFRLIVPDGKRCPMPAKGYPIVLYAHGTGGDYKSFDSDKTGEALSQECVASMGIDQIFHGTRPGAPKDGPSKESEISALFFNFSNALAARTNPRQAAVDEIARARFVASGSLVISAELSSDKKPITFDPARIAFFGHSQGGLNGPLMLAVDDGVRGGVLSGAGSAINRAMLEKTKPDPSIAGLVKVLLGIEDSNLDELTPFHPALTLVQNLIDPADAVNYYEHLAFLPLSGRKVKSVLMTEGVGPDGVGDSYAPPRTIEAGAIAGHFPLANPVVWPIAELETISISALSLPITGNMAGGKATAAIAQFKPEKGDGHFVVFNVPRARLMAAKFCRSLLETEVPSIVEP